MGTVYIYNETDSENRKSIKVKGSIVYYLSEDDLDCVEVVGITEFSKPKRNKDSILIDQRTYAVRELKSKDKVTGYLETQDGKYVAFYKEGILGLILIFLLWLIFITLYLLLRNKPSSEGGIKDIKPEIPLNRVELEYQLPEEIVIGGEEGTDVTLVPESEIEYATYWGYQNITITEGMKVPLINKETNEHYIVFVIYDKEGNVITTSDYIPPGRHFDWDAYSYYNGVPGDYFHDVKVIWCKPIYDDNGEIVKFKAGTASPRTPDFKVTIK